MAEPCNFEESNCVMGPPQGVGERDVHSIYARRQRGELGTEFVSCWKLDANELELVKATGRIYVVQAGGMSPHYILGGAKPVWREGC